jgi:hypothetical protein
MCRKAEHNLVVRYKNITFIAWVHLVDMNVGGVATTIAMIFAGLAGPGIRGVIIGENDSLQPNAGVMDLFILPIVIFRGMLSIGVISGGLEYIATYLQKHMNL